MSGGWGGGGGSGGGGGISITDAISGNGSLNGGNTTVVPSPASGDKYLVTDLNLYNNDAGPQTITISLVDSGGATSVIKVVTLSGGDSKDFGGMLLDTTTKSLVVNGSTFIDYAVTYGKVL